MSYNRKWVFASACLGMLVFGIVLTLLGAILPAVTERFAVDKAQAGTLFTLLSFGILVGSLVFGPVADRYGYKGLLLLCLALVLLSLEGIAFAPSLVWLQVAVAAIGFGGGVINGATNAVVSDTSEGERGAGLSLLGVFCGIGAVVVLLGLWLLLGRASYAALVAGFGLAVLPPIILTALVRFPTPKQTQGLPLREGCRMLGDPILLLFGLTLLLQAGMELTVSGWVTTFLQERMSLHEEASLLVLSLYWSGLIVSRLILGSVLRRVSPMAALPACIGIALLGASLLLSSASLPLAAVGTFLVGFGLAAGFPIVMGLVGDRYAALSGTAFSLVLTMSLVGSMSLPYLTGVLGQSFGLRASLLIVPAGLVLQLLLLNAVLRRTSGAVETTGETLRQRASA